MSRRFKLPNASEVVAAPGSTQSGLTYRRIPFSDLDGRLEDNTALRYNASIGLQIGPGTQELRNDGSGYLATNLIEWDAAGLLLVYRGLFLEGNGIPAIVDDVALTGQVANIASTNFTNAGVAGTYRLGYYLVCTTAAVGAGTIVFAATFNDGTAVRTLTGTGVLMTATNKASTFTNADINGSLIRLGSGSIAYSLTVTGIYNTAVYSLFCSLERLS